MELVGCCGECCGFFVDLWSIFVLSNLVEVVECVFIFLFVKVLLWVVCVCCLWRECVCRVLWIYWSVIWIFVGLVEVGYLEGYCLVCVVVEEFENVCILLYIVFYMVDLEIFISLEECCGYKRVRKRISMEIVFVFEKLFFK